MSDVPRPNHYDWAVLYLEPPHHTALCRVARHARLSAPLPQPTYRTIRVRSLVRRTPCAGQHPEELSAMRVGLDRSVVGVSRVTKPGEAQRRAQPLRLAERAPWHRNQAPNLVRTAVSDARRRPNVGVIG